MQQIQNKIQKTINFVKDTLSSAEGGHDWWHIYRVWQISKQIATNEKVDLFIVEIGALLHDIADSKFYNGDEDIGPRKAREFLKSIDVDQNTIERVVKIIENVSFKGQNHIQKYKSIELDIVQDADRLDAMGAIGIARTFNYSGHKKGAIYNPDIKPNLNQTREEHRKGDSVGISHFYEKLLLIKDMMNTKSGKKLAEHRHEFMEKYLEEFYKEWDGKL